MCLETPASNSIIVLNLWEAIEMLLYELTQTFADHKLIAEHLRNIEA